MFCLKNSFSYEGTELFETDISGSFFIWRSTFFLKDHLFLSALPILFKQDGNPKQCVSVPNIMHEVESLSSRSLSYNCVYMCVLYICIYKMVNIYICLQLSITQFWIIHFPGHFIFFKSPLNYKKSFSKTHTFKIIGLYYFSRKKWSWQKDFFYS